MDFRDYAAMKSGRGPIKHVDHGRMLATVRISFEDEDGEYCDELRTVPFRYEVCPTCDGKGKYVNPSIDAHGLSADDFYEDPDFAEGYFGGMFDVTCAECGGMRVVPAFDDEEVLKTLDDFEASMREEARESEMGY